MKDNVDYLRWLFGDTEPREPNPAVRRYSVEIYAAPKPRSARAVPQTGLNREAKP